MKILKIHIFIQFLIQTYLSTEIKTVYYPPSRLKRQLDNSSPAFRFGDKIPKRNFKTNIKNSKNSDNLSNDDDDSGSGNYGMDRAVVHRIDEKQQSISYEYDSYNDDEDLYENYDDENSGDGNINNSGGSTDRFKVDGLDPKCKYSKLSERENKKKNENISTKLSRFHL